MIKNEQIKASAKEVKFLQTKSAALVASPDSTRDPEFSLALIKLREYLPPKPYCDRLFAIYCEHFERTFRVLHVPTFSWQYEQLWSGGNLDACSPSTIPQLTCMMTMAYHMDDVDRVSDDYTHKAYLKGAAADFVQDWINELSRKHRTELSTLQAEILLLLAKSLRGLHPEKLWSSSGALVRTAMVMGLNIDPSTISSFTPYQAEMRRRLWATILEIDLQASLATALPIVSPHVGEAMIPSNINDWEFDESSETLPPSRPLTEYTDNIYQVVLATSLPARLKTSSFAQHTSRELQEALVLGRTVGEYIKSKPLVLSLHKNAVAPLDGGSLLHRVLLDLYLRRPILCLYKAVLNSQRHESPSHTDMQQHCLDSSMALLTYQELYTVSSLASFTTSPMAHQDFFYRCCKMDILWAALTCCQRIKVLQEAPSNVRSDQQNGQHDILLNQTVRETIGYMIDRIGRKGNDLKDIVFLALVFQSVQRSDVDTPASKAAEMHQAVEKTLASCREKLLQTMLSSQAGPATKHVNTFSATMLHTTTPPISNPRLTPVADTMQWPIEIAPGSSQQWFESLPELAAEYMNFQGNPTDALTFGIQQEWDWERMWQ
jgi:hypothetical protein